jgi:hypothetical protein
MRPTLLVLPLLIASLAPSPAQAQVDVGFSVRLPGVAIGLQLPASPAFVQVPGHPVFYEPHASANFFFADARYWLFRDDRWYSSARYEGPWEFVAPAYVPSVVLRVPVRYYRHPPASFAAWRADGSPRWGEHWGRGWEQRRAGWDRWDHHAAARLAPPSAPGHRDRQDGAHRSGRGNGHREDHDKGHRKGHDEDRGHGRRGGR